MKIKRTAGDSGLIRIILLIVIAILVISYFGINIRQLVSSPTTQDNVSYVASTTVTVWDKYLKVPAGYLWNEIFLELIWKPAINGLKDHKWEVPSTMAPASSTPGF